MANSEIRYYMTKRRASIERQKLRDASKDVTLDKKRYTNYKNTGYAFS